MLVLIKVLTWAASPIGFLVWAGLLGLILATRTRRCRRTGRVLLWISVSQVVVFAMPLVSGGLSKGLEDRTKEIVKQNVVSPPKQKYDAIVILGGGIGPAYPPDRPYPDLGPDAGRVWHAARLYKQGASDKIIISGGRGPGLEGRNDIQTEAEATRIFLKDLGIPDSALILEGESRTTQENASFTAKLMPGGKIALVTSTFHIPRSIANFRKYNLVVDAHPSDCCLTPSTSPLYAKILPTAGSLEWSSIALKEWLALAISY